jgi:hypothetical protein
MRAGSAVGQLFAATGRIGYEPGRLRAGSAADTGRVDCSPERLWSGSAKAQATGGFGCGPGRLRAGSAAGRLLGGSAAGRVRPFLTFRVGRVAEVVGLQKIATGAGSKVVQGPSERRSIGRTVSV